MYDESHSVYLREDKNICFQHLYSAIWMCTACVLIYLLLKQVLRLLKQQSSLNDRCLQNKTNPVCAEFNYASGKKIFIHSETEMFGRETHSKLPTRVYVETRKRTIYGVEDWVTFMRLPYRNQTLNEFAVWHKAQENAICNFYRTYLN